MTKTKRSREKKIPAIHIVAVVLGSLEIILFGGVIFGWSSIVYVYKDIGYFADKCDVGRSLQDNLSHAEALSGNTSQLLSKVTEVTRVTKVASDLNSSLTTFPTLSTEAENLNGRDALAPADNTTGLANITATTAVSPGDNLISRNTKFSSSPSWISAKDATYSSRDVYSSTTQSSAANTALSSSTTPANITTTFVLSTSSDVEFSELSCKEQMEIRSEQEEGASRVCEPQDEQFNLVYSLAIGINGVLCLPNGIMYDRMGIRFTRVVLLFFFCVGALLLIFASPSTSYLLYPGFLCLVYGGYTLLVINMPLASLIPRYRATIVAIFSGCFDTSSANFLFFKAAYEAGISVNTCFIAQGTVFFLLVAGSTFLLFPKDRILTPLPEGFRLKCRLCGLFCRRKTTYQTREGGELYSGLKSSVVSVVSLKSLAEVAENAHQRNDATEKQEDERIRAAYFESNKLGHHNPSFSTSYTDLEIIVSEDGTISYKDGTVVDTGAKDGEKSSRNDDQQKTSSDGRTPNENSSTENVGTKAEVAKDIRTFRQVICSPMFLSHLFWVSSQRFISWLFIGIFNPWITRLACGDKSVVSHYTSVYAIMQFFGLCLAPWSGRLMDRRIKGAVEKYGHPRFERVHAAIANFALDSTIAVLLTAGTLVPVIQVQYISFFLHCLHRSFLYGPNAAFVANAFPSKHFGKVLGVTLTVSAIVGFLQYPCFLIVFNLLGGETFWMNVGLLALSLLSYIHPFNVWRYLHRAAAKHLERRQLQAFQEQQQRR